MTADLNRIITATESHLARYYGFHPQTSVVAHLMDRSQLQRSLGGEATKRPEWNARGGVWLLETMDHEELFVGVHFDEEILQRLSHRDPTASLTGENLDAFCVLVEEISHFHLIVNRAEARRKVSKLELEWQGEVDKLLVSGLLLEQQQGHPHLVPLARKLYDLSVITSEDKQLYWQATKYAARFWHGVGRDDTDLSSLRDVLQWSYWASWRQKHAFLLEPVAQWQRAS